MMLHAFALILSTINGTWSITSYDSITTLELRWSNGDGSNSNTTRDVNVGALGIGSALASSGQHVTFGIHREAGTYAMEGWVGNGKGGGTYTFTPDEAFFADMRGRGIDADSENKEIAFADLDVTREYVDDLARTGYKLDFGDVVTFRALRIDRPYIESLRSQGIGDLNQHDIVSFRALGVDGPYIAMLARHGYAHLSAHQYVTLKALRVDEPYIEDLASHGLTHLTVEQLVNYKALGIR